MIDELKPYPEYKDSGLPWLGMVPAHWDVRRLRHTVDMMVSNIDKHTKKGEQAVRLCNYVDVYKNEKITERLQFMRATASKDEIARFALRLGDVVITKDSEIWTDIGVPALVEYTAPDFVCGYHLAILRPRCEMVIGAFLLRAIQSQGVAAQFHVGANGVTRYGLSHADIKNTLIPLPPIEEQAAIVQFLDYANGKIERAIRAKKKLIALLNEQKQAIIHRAVTRGLDANVKLKPSGIPWLGDVPAHWKPTKLYRITDPGRPIMYGIVLPGPHVENGVFIVKGGNCESGRLRPEFLSRTTFEIESRYARSRLRGSDIVYSIRGSIGSAQIVPDELAGANLTQDAARIAPGCGINPQWLLFAVRSRSFFNKLEAGAVGATIRGINIRDLRRADIVVPPTDEQIRIAAFLEKETMQFDVAITRLEREITLLREYRTTLTADVVTGKLDVRGGVKQLRAAAAEPPPADELPDDIEDEPAMRQ